MAQRCTNTGHVWDKNRLWDGHGAGGEEGEEGGRQVWETASECNSKELLG